LAIFCEIDISQALIDLRNGIPAGSVLVNATLFHEEIDEVFLLLTNLAEVV
jgi:hypothetical protein